MKSKVIFIFLTLIIKSLTLVNLLRTNGNIPQYRSLRPFKTKDYRIRRAKSFVCYYPNCVVTYNAILEPRDIEKNPDRQSRKEHNATNKKSTSKKASSNIYPICNKGAGNNRKQLLCIYCLKLTHFTCSKLTTEMKNKTTSAPPIN